MDRYIKSMPHHMIHICIDRYDEYSISGRAYSPVYKDCIQFHDLNQVFLKLDHIFDVSGNPLASQSMRSFTQKETVSSYQPRPRIIHDYNDLLKYNGSAVTLDILVKSRRKTTWQGTLFYQNQEVSFETILDLIYIILDVLKKEL